MPKWALYCVIFATTRKGPWRPTGKLHDIPLDRLDYYAWLLFPWRKMAKFGKPSRRSIVLTLSNRKTNVSYRN
jgi:hypothetical protein